MDGMVDTADGWRPPAGTINHALIGLSYPDGSETGYASSCFGQQIHRWFHPARLGVFLVRASATSMYRQSGWTYGATCVTDASVPGYGYRCTGSLNIMLMPLYAEDAGIRCETSGGPASGPPNVGQPVNVTTGNVWFDQTDAVLPALGTDIIFRRSYNSLNAFKYRGGAFGPGWHHSFERSIRVAPGTTKGLILRGSDGVPLYFQDNDDQDLTYKPFAPVTEESWIVRQPATNDYVRYFRAGGSEEYNSSGQLTAVVDKSGNRTILTWQGTDLVAIADQGGRALTFGYQNGFLTTLSGPAGLIATYEYDIGKLARVTYADDPPTGYQFGYLAEAGGRYLLESVKDLDTPANMLEFHEYVPGTGKGRTSERGGGQEKLTLDYDYPDKTKVTDANGNITWYQHWEYAGIRQVVKIEGPCAGCGSGSGQQVQQWSYDTKGRVTSYTNGAGSVTAYTYDADGDLVTEVDPLGNTTSYAHDAEGRTLSIRRPDGGLTSYTHGIAGPVSITERIHDWLRPRRRITRIAYGTHGKPTSITDPRGKVTTLTYDASGDLAAVADPLGHSTTYAYDPMGRRTTVTDAVGSVTTTAYDGRGRPVRITRHDGTHTDFSYDSMGRRSTVTDPLGRLTEYGYDSAGRLSSVQDPDNGQTIYGYDVMGNLTSLTDAGNRTTSFEYDPYNRVKKTVYPGGAFETYIYDAAGRLATRIDRRGITTTFSYDGASRLTSKTYSDGTPQVTFTYDSMGRTLTAANQTDTLTWTYDLVGQLLSEASAKNATVVAYDHDAGGNLQRLTLNDAIAIAYAYDDDSRLTSITRNANVFTFGYDASHQRTSLVFPNGVSTTHAYDALGRLTSLAAVSGTTTVTSFGYTHDDADNRLRKTTASHSEDYTYDPLNRLRQVLSNAIPNESYTYDGVGNRLTSLTAPGWAYDERNRLLSQGSTTYGYDANGNLIQKTEGGVTSTYEWDAEDRLKWVCNSAPCPQSSAVASFKYDALGRRVEKVVGAATHAFAYDGEDILRYTRPGSVWIYVHGPGIDEPLARENEAGAWRFFHADGLGSLVQVTNASGVVTESFGYDAFGRLLTGTPSGYAFTGREWDGEIGLYYYRARYYDPKIGRFISEDPSRTLAEYSYVDSNPTTFIDPSGFVRIVPRVTVSPTAGDKGKTFLDGAFVMWDCAGGDCGGWKAKFTVLVNIRMIYSQVCPPWSKRHEQLHVDQFIANVATWANRFLGPVEFKTFDTWEECNAAASAAVDLFRRQPDELYEIGQSEIDRYIPCLIQF
jgi:RHS repeat-associated protein